MTANGDSFASNGRNTPVNSSYYEGENVATRINDLLVCDA